MLGTCGLHHRADHRHRRRRAEGDPLSPTTAPYGSWRSPLGAAAVASGGVNLSQPKFDGEDLYWIEGRPAEGGRNAIVRLRGGELLDVTPADFNARTMVHEYGGGDYAVAGGTVWAARFEDQRLYRIDPGQDPRALTPEGAFRYADLEPDLRRGVLYCVREDHTMSDQDCVNQLVAVPLDGGTPVVLAGGRDFYSSPRLSPDGQELAWLAWDHPNMPWDGTELWTAGFDDAGALDSPELVAGGPSESIFQPDWSAGGDLHFVSDRSGWWSLYRRGQDEPVAAQDGEFGVPQWQFGMATYSFLEGGGIVAASTEAGRWRLGLVDAGRTEPFDLPYSLYTRPATGPGSRVVVAAGSANAAGALIEVDVRSGGHRVLRSASAKPVDTAYVPEIDSISFPSGRGTAYGLLYGPANPEFRGEGPPPLLVNVHGGPTAAARPVYSAEFAFFTSRGFAVLDLNYRGSTGYGRAYRSSLYGEWGIADVEDAVAAAAELARRGLADPARTAIRGGSAGGYTTLAAAAFRPDVFSCGTSYFGLSDLRVFDQDTHKFEAKYIQRLIGGAGNYEARSPITRSDDIRMPLLILQGLDDRIVPPNQAEIIIESLVRRGVPHAYLAFPGEGHGFRQAANIQRALEAELAFYARVFGFTPADDLPPLDVVG